MSILKEYGNHVLYCDNCGAYIEFDTFQDAVDFKKTAKWKSQKRNGEWEDVCPECAGERGKYELL